MSRASFATPHLEDFLAHDHPYKITLRHDCADAYSADSILDAIKDKGGKSVVVIGHPINSDRCNNLVG